MRESGRSIEQKVQRNVSGALRIRSRGFLRSYKATVFAQKLDRMPSMAIGSRIRFTGMHEHGGTVRPKGGLLLIPFPKGPFANSMAAGRIGGKRFKDIIRRLMASGNAYFRQVNGRLILFAENIAENDRQLRAFKRNERRQTGARLKRGADIPVAIGITSAQLRKKTDVIGTVVRNLGEITAAIEHEIARSSRGR